MVPFVKLAHVFMNINTLLVGGLMLLAAAAQAGQHTLSGRLLSDGWCGFDWQYLESGRGNLSAMLERPQGLAYEGRFTWEGEGVVPAASGAVGEHALLALVQGAHVADASVECPASGQDESLLSSASRTPRSPLFRQGIGILVSPRGLVLEHWYADRTAQVWLGDDAQRCALQVPAGRTQPPCLAPDEASSDPAGAGYLDALPHGFALQKGREYCLGLSLNTTGSGGAHLQLDATLGEVRPDDVCHALQRAQLRLPVASVFTGGESVVPVVGRTPADFSAPPQVASTIRFSVHPAGQQVVLRR